jgi:hypothetical protein
MMLRFRRSFKIHPNPKKSNKKTSTGGAGFIFIVGILVVV